MNLVLIWRHRRGLRRTSTAAWRHRRGLAQSSAAVVVAGIAVAVAAVAAVVVLVRRRRTDAAPVAPSFPSTARSGTLTPIRSASQPDGSEPGLTPEELADEIGEESFPASDPPGSY